ncbi:MAG: metallophosphoesterase family protein [Pseudomonadota bacterium]
MRIAVVSDVHGNRHALEAVVRAADSEAVDAWLCLGDVVGYYYWPAECLAILESKGAHFIAGNHERFMAACRQDPSRLAPLTARYGHGLAEALSTLKSAELDRVLAWPERRRFEAGVRTLDLCHGSPWDGDAYVYPDAPVDIRTRLMAGDADVLLFGHTHYQTCWSDDGRMAVNPGSVGQPRDRRPGACWALLDLTRGEVSLRREEYDVTPVLAECQRRDPGIPYLQDVLTRTQ